MMLSVTEPDMILIGSDFLTGRTESGVGRLSHALGAFAERNPGVYLIADGVDDECALVTARTIGATHAIGALFTSPTTVADIDCTHLAPLPERRVALDTGGHVTPFDLVGQRLPSRVGSKRALLAMSKSLEQHAMRDGATVVLGTFQRVENYTSSTARRWNNVAQAAGFVGVYGVGMSSMRDGDVRHAPLSGDDPLVREWTVVVVAPHFTAMLSARDRHQDAVHEMERTFDFVQTYDRELVTKAMYVILSRFV